jgi:outer membrane protein TolC
MNLTIHGAKRRIIPIVVLALAPALSASAQTLKLPQAELLALAADPGVRAALSARTAMDEMAVAARQWEDPKVRVGMLSLPVDSFELGQEPMTQLHVGIQQAFPRGETRDLMGQRYGHLAGRQEALAADRERQLVRQVREQFLEVQFETRMLQELEQTSRLFSRLVDLASDYYGTGRGQQEDVLNARLELARIEERQEQGRQRLDVARSRLAEHIGEHAWLAVPDDWPNLPAPARAEELKAGLPVHPRLLALRQQIEFAQVGEELARQKYRPGFALDVGYGARNGHNPDGSSRPDFLSVMLTMDLPLFTANRQDRVMASRVAETESVTYMRDQVYRQMAAELELLWRELDRTEQRLGLYEQSLLPQASEFAEASFSAYQDATGDLVSLVRAWITENELRIDHARLQAAALKTRAALHYFSGASS